MYVYLHTAPSSLPQQEYLYRMSQAIMIELLKSTWLLLGSYEAALNDLTSSKTLRSYEAMWEIMWEILNIIHL
ncbi:hypothetical protein L3Y34_011080 [Caenorhabditis briggsae]|uniref:Uncharacterized protein n=1 Tax=Caenorhabditis briggsae TaxID=6238 RepID=A0AAE9CTI9_CAEBR|nr:hypothetical protein L3Y34_011080 [Caenorhabditis briggsae]